MSKIKVLMFVDSLDVGGLEKGIVNVALRLNKDKFEPFFCCLRTKSHFGKKLRKKGIKIYELNKKPGLIPGLLPKIRKILKEENVDIIHTHNPGPLIYGTIASLFIKNIRVHTDHNSFSMSPKKRALIFSRLLLFFIDKIIAVSGDVKERLIDQIKVNPKKITIVHNGVDIKKFDIDVDLPKEKLRLGLSNDSKIIGIVARLSEEKDHYTAIKAFRLVNKKIKNSILLIVGDGHLRKPLENFVEKNNIRNVKFLGVRDDIPQLMNLFDVVTLTSFDEGCSYVILESMAASKPSIVTNVGGNPELIKNNETGILIPKQDIGRLSGGIIMLLKNKNLRERIGKRARKRVEIHFTIERQVHDYENLYTQIFSSKRL